MRMGFILCCLVALCACAPSRPELARCPEIAQEYFSEHNRRDTADYLSYDVETQFEIYICGQQFMMPAHLELATAFASQGETVVPYLRAKLREELSDETFRDIVWLYREMYRLETYDVGEDLETMEMMRRRNEALRSQTIRRSVDEWLSDITARR